MLLLLFLDIVISFIWKKVSFSLLSERGGSIGFDYFLFVSVSFIEILYLHNEHLTLTLWDSGK